MTPLWIGVVGMGTVLVLPGCSEQPQKAAPSEQEIHAGDNAVATGTRGRHLYQCDDNRTLFVDFKDQGMALAIRERETDRPILLTAPVQGLQYIGDHASARIADGKLRLQAGSDPERVCRRLTQ